MSESGSAPKDFEAEFRSILDGMVQNPEDARLNVALKSLFDREQEQRLEDLGLFDPLSLAWLALAPGWTEHLAARCEFPTGDFTSLTEFLSRAEAAGLCTRNTSTDIDGSQMSHFWMPEAARVKMLNKLRQARGVAFLHDSLADIAQRVMNAKEDNLEPAPVVMRWAEVALHAGGGPGNAGRWLTDRIQSLLEKDDLGEALAWVRAGTSVAQAVGGEIESSVRIGNRRVDLAYRYKQDLRHLERFQERTELTDEFLRLLEEPETGRSNDVWALHYIGMGGVGKTMLLRHITAKLIRGLGGTSTRVDFDHLSPDYPVRRPAQLLAELADELKLQVTSGKQDYIFEEFRGRVSALHEALSEEQPHEDPLDSINRQEFLPVLRSFCALLELLPRPLVFILDTCEELAKLQPGGTRIPGVEATFKILEEIHSQIPWLRVVFAGRRLLAQSGGDLTGESNGGWVMKSLPLEHGRSYLPEHKPYLRLREIRGFDGEEAGEYFSKTRKLDISDEMRDAILKRGRETGSAADVTWVPERPGDKDARYNPFDLALYADWVSEDPKLSVDVIASGETDPYIDMRIIRRINQPNVQALLPAVVLLRRFDKKMLRPALRASEAAFAEAYREISDQEWIECQPDEALNTTFLEINQSLYPRLRKYYDHPSRSSRLEDAKSRLAPNLAEMVRDRPLRDLDVNHVDAALCLLPPPQAATLWDGLSRRIAAEVEWGWAQKVAGHILGEDGAVGTVDSCLRSAVRATLTSALIHSSPDYDATEGWIEVEKTAGKYPDPATGEWLARRARAGQISARSSKIAPGARAKELWEALAAFPEGADASDPIGFDRVEQLAASLCAAIESLLEVEESKGAASPRLDASPFPPWCERLRNCGVSSELIAFAWSLGGRVFALNSRWDDANRMLGKAEEEEPLEGRGGQPDSPRPDNLLTRQRWADWRAPDSLVLRVRLERLLLTRPEVNPPSAERLVELQQKAVRRLRSIDAERLVSLTLKLRSALKPPDATELEAIGKADDYDMDRHPVCVAHRSVPPLFATVALGWLAIGNVERALDLVEERREAATETRRDPGTVREAEVAKLQIIRRMRLDSHGKSLIKRMSESKNLNDMALALPLIALIGQPDRRSPAGSLQQVTPYGLHIWWSCQSLLKPETASLVLDQMCGLQDLLMAQAALRPEETDILSALLDMEEARLVADRLKIAANLSSFSLPDFAVGLTDLPWGESEPRYRLLLRKAALGPRRGDEPEAPIGSRRRAEIALEEGELLALRLPERAIYLFDLAHTWFEQADDPVGMTIASTLRVIALINAGEAQSVRQSLNTMLWPDYERLTVSGVAADLPPWHELVELRDGTGELSAKLGHPWWEGWLSRIFYCLVW
ncbi:MAG TPA: ATP-binding protein, partial [Blastocatellia bacterium]|nr:ATP-binding protein [Blastocatellia bacterium]